MTANYFIPWSLIAPAAAAGLLVLLTHVPLGREVLRRGIIFIDLAIAQIAGLGVILAYSLGWHPQGWRVQVVALTAALSGAWLLSKTERHLARHQEALIGTVFVLAATASLLLLAGQARSNEHLQTLLNGQILWVSWPMLGPLATLAMLMGFSAWRYPALYTACLRGRYFYLLFAVTITFSVQVVGVYLVFASLVIPALSAYQNPQALRYAFAVGLLGYSLGLGLSIWLDWPTGACIVWGLAVAALGLQLGVIFKQAVKS